MLFICEILRESWTMQILKLFHVLNLIQQYLLNLSLFLWMELHTGDIYHSFFNTHSHLKICRIYHIKLLMYDLLKVWFSQGQRKMDMWSFRCLYSPLHATDLGTWIFSRFTYRGNEIKSWSWGDSFSFSPQFHILLDELLPWNWSRWFTSVNLSRRSTFWFKTNTINNY